MAGIPDVQMCEDVPTVNPSILTEKKCTKCGQMKSLDKFQNDKRIISGIGARCKTCQNLRCSIYGKNNREKIRELNRAWVKNNKGKALKNWSNAHLRRRNNKNFKLNVSMASGIWHAIGDKKGGRRWESLVDFTLEQLVKHIEKQFTEGMSWDRYMAGEIHIDHKIPKAAFNFETESDVDFKRCWSLKNLQPMWASENCSKRATLQKPFQPSLTIEG